MAPAVACIHAASYGISLPMSAFSLCLLLTRLSGVFFFFFKLIINEVEQQTRQQRAPPKKAPFCCNRCPAHPWHGQMGTQILWLLIFCLLLHLLFVFLVSLDFSRSPGSRPLLGTEQCHGGDDGLCLAGCESIRCADSNAAEPSLKENK